MNSTLANRLSFPRFASLSILAPLGVCAYVFGMAVPFKWDIPLMVLAVTGVLAFLVQRRDGAQTPSGAKIEREAKRGNDNLFASVEFMSSPIRLELAVSNRYENFPVHSVLPFATS